MIRQEQLLILIKKYPGRSAFQLALKIDGLPADVSSLLRKMLLKGSVTRKSGKGPKGGFGYYLKRRVS